MNSKQQMRMAELVEKLAHDEISESEFRELEDSLLGSAEARSFYTKLMQHHSHLLNTKAAGALPGMDKTRSKPSKITSLFSLVSVAAAAIVITFTLATLYNGFDKNPTPADLSVAVLDKSSSAKWGNCSVPTLPGTAIPSGTLELIEGTASLTMNSGVVVKLEAPVKFELKDPMKTFIHYGVAVADVPERAIGFRMDAPDIQVTDYGTVFAVSVNKEGKTNVDVLDGEVEVFHEKTNKKERLLASESTNKEFSREPQPKEEASIALQAIKHATLMPKYWKSHREPDVLMVKYPEERTEGYARKSLITFPVTEDFKNHKGSISLQLQQIQSNFGLASLVPDCEFALYALNREASWEPSTVTWNSAPGNDPKTPDKANLKRTTKIGTFIIPEGQQWGMVNFSIDSVSKLLYQSRTKITFLLVRETCELQPSGLVHSFAAVDSPGKQGPRLILSKPKAEPK